MRRRYYAAKSTRAHGGRGYGYTVRMDPPKMSAAWADVEGVGLCRVTPRAVCAQGWFRSKRDAEARARVMQRWADGRQARSGEAS